MDCPICFESSAATTRHVAGPCGHGVCLKCAGQLFLENAAHQREGLDTGSEFIPGLGKCPLCRQVLLYGDLKYVDSLEDAFPGDPLDDMLLGTVYVGNPMGIGWASIHLFEPTDDDDETAPSSTPIQNGAIQPLSSSPSYILKGDTRTALTDPKFYRGTNTISFRINGAPRSCTRSAPTAAAAAAAATTTTTTATTTTTTEGLAVLSFSDNYSFISRGILLLHLPSATIRTSLDGIWQRCHNGTRLMMFNLQCVVYDDSDGSCCLGSFRMDDRGTTVFLLVRHQAIVSHPEFGRGGSAVGAAGDSSLATDDRVPIEDDDVWTALRIIPPGPIRLVGRTKFDSTPSSNVSSAARSVVVFSLNTTAAATTTTMACHNNNNNSNNNNNRMWSCPSLARIWCISMPPPTLGLLPTTTTTLFPRRRRRR
jgi:hypothetical protein